MLCPAIVSDQATPLLCKALFECAHTNFRYALHLGHVTGHETCVKVMKPELKEMKPELNTARKNTL